ncbi:aldo-keto reductase AKR2E4-like isoform X2 [Pectinophora gossypiella]|uniref:aldo-keto reductase AKR2E4-like isoform X2 n=1 Tax=Pectinophora gossypiella TaxID=13191 RepID=UPI00214F3BDE|nr:aldo-keto reductase AKR2E4-like isoform X2 [Pectinophora gossypiella]
MARRHVLVAVEAPRIEMNDGNKIPIIALGTYGSAQDVQRMRQTVTWAVEAGYRHIDTASIYKNEEQIGQGIKDVVNKGLVKRENLFITTKLWNDRHDREQVVPALKESLANLDLDYVDLYLIHSPNATYEDGTPANVDYLETWRGMEEAKALGLTKSIGVSNFNVEQVNRLFANSKVKPAVNQIEVHPSLTQEPLVSHNQKLGVVVMAYSPFGFLVNRDNIADAPPPKVDDPTLLKMASKYGKTTGQIVLRYLIDRGTIPIPKSTNKNRLQQNIDILDFELTPEEIHTINKFNMNRGVFN